MRALPLLLALASNWGFSPPPLIPRPHMSRSQSAQPKSQLLLPQRCANNDNNFNFPFQPPSSQQLTQIKSLSLASLIGLLVGLSVVAFKESISTLQTTLNTYDVLPPATIPILGGILVTSLTLLNNQPFDSTQTLSNTLSQRATIQSAAIKTLAAIATLSTGNSLGPEGPLVELGGTLGKLIGNKKQLTAAGAAAGISAGFNAPLAGVFFAVEVINSVENSSDDDSITTSQGLTVVLISSAIAALVSRLLLNDSLAFDLLTPMTSADTIGTEQMLLQLPYYVGLGVLSGIFSSCFAPFNGFVKNDVFGRINIPDATKPILGAVIVCAISTVFPQVLFRGYENVNSLVANDDSISTAVLIELLIAKIIATSSCLASGLVGGSFAPTLFIGSTLGAVYHNAIQYVTGGRELLSSTSIYCYEGATSMLAGLFRAPLTSSILLFELTRDYDQILPSLACAGVAVFTAELIGGRGEGDDE